MRRFLVTACLGLSACASGPSFDLRNETGQVGAAEFSAAPWRSENIRNAPAGDVYAFNFIARSAEDGELLRDFMGGMEAEFAELRRFPVDPLELGGSAQDVVAQLLDLGEIELPSGAASVKGRFVLEYVCREMHKEYSPSSYAPLQSVSGKIHEYWLEGRASLIPFTAADGGRVVRGEPIWATPNFRSRSSWKFEVTNLRGEHTAGFDPRDPEAVFNARRPCQESLLFRISKEVYSKIGVEGLVTGVKRSGRDTLLSASLGSDRGVLPGQPMFVMWKSGDLQSYIAKAVVDTTSATGSTMRIISWNSGDEDAAAMSRDPSNYWNTNQERLVVRTEGLTEPPVWQERRQRVDRLAVDMDADWRWMSTLGSAHRAQIEQMLRSR